MNRQVRNILKYNRIMIAGNNGSGKSYFAVKLSERTGLPLVHLDTLFWRPNWQMPSQEEWRETTVRLVKEENWILDGNVNHGGTMAIRFEAADLIIFLDINRLVCLFSVLKRHGNHLGLPSYLEEKFDKEFFRFLKGIWTYPNYRKQILLSLQEKYPHKAIWVLKGRKMVKKQLKQWHQEKAGA